MYLQAQFKYLKKIGKVKTFLQMVIPSGHAGFDSIKIRVSKWNLTRPRRTCNLSISCRKRNLHERKTMSKNKHFLLTLGRPRLNAFGGSNIRLFLNYL
jgi:hypothetical protein